MPRVPTFFNRSMSSEVEVPKNPSFGIASVKNEDELSKKIMQLLTLSEVFRNEHARMSKEPFEIAHPDIDSVVQEKAKQLASKCKQLGFDWEKKREEILPKVTGVNKYIHANLLPNLPAPPVPLSEEAAARRNVLGEFDDVVRELESPTQSFDGDFFGGVDLLELQTINKLDLRGMSKSPEPSPPSNEPPVRVVAVPKLETFVQPNFLKTEDDLFDGMDSNILYGDELPPFPAIPKTDKPRVISLSLKKAPKKKVPKPLDVLAIREGSGSSDPDLVELGGNNVKFELVPDPDLIPSPTNSSVSDQDSSKTFSIAKIWTGLDPLPSRKVKSPKGDKPLRLLEVPKQNNKQ